MKGNFKKIGVKKNLPYMPSNTIIVNRVEEKEFS